jgi:hypothetical protein
MVKLLGRDQSRQLLDVLELPDDERWVFVSRMFARDDGQALAEVLADVEQDLTGKTRERLIEVLRWVLGLGHTAPWAKHDVPGMRNRPVRMVVLAVAVVVGSCTSSSTQVEPSPAMEPVLREAELQSGWCYLLAVGACSVVVQFDEGEVTMSFDGPAVRSDRIVEASLTEDGSTDLVRFGAEIAAADLGDMSGSQVLDGVRLAVAIDDGSGHAIRHTWGVERRVSVMHRVYDRIRTLMHHLAACQPDPWVVSETPCRPLPMQRH